MQVWPSRRRCTKHVLVWARPSSISRCESVSCDSCATGVTHTRTDARSGASWGPDLPDSVSWIGHHPLINEIKTSLVPADAMQFRIGIRQVTRSKGWSGTMKNRMSAECAMHYVVTSIVTLMCIPVHNLLKSIIYVISLGCICCTSVVLQVSQERLQHWSELKS